MVWGQEGCGCSEMWRGKYVVYSDDVKESVVARVMRERRGECKGWEQR